MVSSKFMIPLNSENQVEANGHEVTTPVRYEMKGYNSLLGSHYDHYYLDYVSFSAEKPNDNVFVVDRGII